MVTDARVAAEDRITIEFLDRLDLPEDNWLRYEIIDGELHVSSAPHIWHQYASGRFAIALAAWSDRTGAGRCTRATAFGSTGSSTGASARSTFFAMTASASAS